MSSGKLGLAPVTLAVLITGCASQPNMGTAATSQSETTQSNQNPKQRKQGEFYRTETLAPGVGSALFPDPGWR